MSFASDTNNKAYSSVGDGTQTLEQIEEAVIYNRWIASRFMPYLGQKNLEIGAGIGTISAILSKSYPLDLTEISSDCRQVLMNRFAEKSNVKVLDRDYQEVRGSYDCIYSSNVLEHVENDFSYLAKSSELLKGGGFFVAIVPGHQLLLSDFDRSIGHHRRYSLIDRLRLSDEIKIQNLPLRLHQYRYYNPVGAIGWLLKMKILKQDHIKMSDVKKMEALVPYLKKLDLINFGFGQNLLMAFQKIK